MSADSHRNPIGNARLYEAHFGSGQQEYDEKGKERKKKEKERTHYAPHQLKTITNEITSAKKTTDYTWKSDINRTNFNDSLVM